MKTTEPRIYIALDSDEGELRIDGPLSLWRVFLDALHTTPPTAFDQNSEVYKAVRRLLRRYVVLAASGDCGNWNPEEEPEVIDIRRLLGIPKGEL